MKGTVALVVLALAATWAFLFLPLTEPSAPATPKRAASAHDATPSPAAQQPLPHRAAPTGPEIATDEIGEPSVATQPAAASSRPGATPSGRGDVRVLGSGTASGSAKPPRSATQLAESLGERVEYREPTGELGEGTLSPDYKLLEESYVQEARDGAWAVQQELRIRNLLLAGDLGEQIVLVNCQSSVCRVQLEPRGQDPYGELMRVPGLADVLGIDAATPYSLNSAELIVYAKPEALPDPKR